MGIGLTAYAVNDGIVTAKDMSGFSWRQNDPHVFNWHPVLMTFGFVLCSMEAALVYISLPFNHAVKKWLGSFFIFFYPGAAQNVRVVTLPYHIGIGLAILGLVSATVEAGLLEKLTFNGSCNVNGALNGMIVQGYMSSDCVTGNLIGLLVALMFIALVVTIWHAKHAEQERPLEAETTPLLPGGSGEEHTEMTV
ncbi:hypothetical protein PsorP6_018398 [Peronosclerospora sorghi]|nr:hypothetical protein PsorP6_018379 [Peronosclerospora sorghi]KAI9895589.1 hypothetical protein PsorP6_018398 [Peronosclerospora sorghi]